MLVVGAVLLLCGFVAVAQRQLYGQDGGTLLLLPAMFLPLPRPLLGGGDFPPALSFAGVVVVYLVPGSVLLILGWLLKAR
jgi:hypothetical protein